MQEKTEELYREYLENILDIIFDENNSLGKSYPNNIHFSYGDERYRDGYKIIRNQDGDRNFIDKRGKLLSDTWYDDVGLFHDGYARVTNNGKYNYIDKKGKLLSDTWYDDAFGFSCGCARVKINGKYTFIDTKGNLLNDEIYDSINDFSCGYAKIEKNGKENFIDTKGKLLSDIWFDFASDFVDGCATVRLNDKYNIIDTNGKLLCDTEYDEMGFFKYGSATVRKDDKYNIINTKGELLSKVWYEFISLFSFYDGTSLVKGHQGYNLISTEGKLLSKTWFDEIDENRLYHIYVRIGNNYNFINRQGELLSDTWYTCEKDHYSAINRSFYKVSTDKKIEKNVSIKCFEKFLNGYQIKKRITGYQCISNSYHFKVKYEPIAIYGSRYVLCLDNKNVILYDKKSNKYNNIGLIEDVEYNGNFIFDHGNKKTLFMYQDSIIEITDYYLEKLTDKLKINIVDGVKVLSKNDFFFYNVNEISEIVKKEREEHNKKQQEQKNKKDQQRLQKTKNLDEVEREEVRIEQKETLESIKILLNKLAMLQEKTGNYERLKVDNLFIKVGDHKEINPLYIELGMLKYIDLKGETFEDVKMDGIDFRGCNIFLNPQLVYKKNLSNCNFEGMHIPAFMDFRGVDICGTKFSQDNNPKTIDGQNVFFGKARYNATTTYNGISFVEIYGECEKTKGNMK